MNYVQTNPVGIDRPIQNIQTFLHDRLGWANIEAYGRTYNIAGMPMAYIKNDEYRDLFTNDKKNAIICFITDDKHTTEYGDQFTVKIKIVFMVNLKKITNEKGTRPDSFVQQQAIECVKNVRGFRFNAGVELGIGNIFRPISGLGSISSDKFNLSKIEGIDMNPFHIFSLNGEIVYDKKCV